MGIRAINAHEATVEDKSDRSRGQAAGRRASNAAGRRSPQISVEP